MSALMSTGVEALPAVQLMTTVLPCTSNGIATRTPCPGRPPGMTCITGAGHPPSQGVPGGAMQRERFAALSVGTTHAGQGSSSGSDQAATTSAECG